MPAALTRLVLVACLCALARVWTAAAAPLQQAEIPRWGKFEAAFTSEAPVDNPLQDVELHVTFTAPSGDTRSVRGFWDGGRVWRVRFSPDEVGAWTYTTRAVPATDSGLHGRSGRFTVGAPGGATAFDRHGPVRVAASRTFLEHADGTPFFWMADTGWNAALKATPEEWQHYVGERARQRFTAIQWVTTQWRAAPDGDRFGEPAFTGHDRIVVNPEYFQRLDARVAALNEAGLLSVPVLLWSIGGGANPAVNPGFALPEDQAIRLAQYMVARWQGDDIVWILPGDGDYRGERAERWKRIGRAVFGGAAHAPVSLHPGGMHWVLEEFRNESWIDIHGYQSGHGDDERTLRWMVEGPPSTDWHLEPHRPFINLEPPYENHIAYQSKQPISPFTVRRAVYWSLLNAPTAGVSYGGHGVWGWETARGRRPTTRAAGSRCRGGRRFSCRAPNRWRTSRRCSSRSSSGGCGRRPTCWRSNPAACRFSASSRPPHPKPATCSSSTRPNRARSASERTRCHRRRRSGTTRARAHARARAACARVIS